jgi:hypothetical protein
MKKFSSVAIILLCTVLSCREETDPKRPCGVDNAIEDLAWFKGHFEEWESTNWKQFAYIIQARYGYETVFVFQNCCPNCATIAPVYNCSGQQIGTVGGKISKEMLEDQKIIWKSEDSLCNI